MIRASEIARQIGPVIRAERLAQDISRADMAAFVGVKPPEVTRFENAVHVPTLDTVFAFAEAVGLEPEEVIRRARHKVEWNGRRTVKASNRSP